MELSEIKNAAIYCGTYHKYNCGSLFGEWIQLSDFADKDEFIAYCKQLHKDEDDPELMFQDMEYIPSWLGGESWISPIVWDLMNADDDDLDILGHYLQACTIDTDNMSAEELIEEAKEKFVGEYYSAEELGQAMFDEFIAPFFPKQMLSTIEYHFDMKGYGEEFLDDWYEDEGYYYDTNR